MGTDRWVLNHSGPTYKAMSRGVQYTPLAVKRAITLFHIAEKRGHRWSWVRDRLEEEFPDRDAIQKRPKYHDPEGLLMVRATVKSWAENPRKALIGKCEAIVTIGVGGPSNNYWNLGCCIHIRGNEGLAAWSTWRKTGVWRSWLYEYMEQRR